MDIPFQPVSDDSVSRSESKLELDQHETGDEQNYGGIERVEYDEAVKKYGSGRYQIFIFIFLSLITFSTVFNNNGYIFIGANQAHTCKVPDPAPINQSNYEDDNQTATLIYQPSTCTYTKLAAYSNGTNITIAKDVPCDSWVYDQSEFTLTMQSEWNFNSCNKGSIKTTVATSLYMVGFLIGCIILADLSDRYGRNLLLVISSLLMLATGIGAAFAVNYEMLVVMRFLLGIFTAGARNAGFVYGSAAVTFVCLSILVCEIVTYRSTAGMIHGTVYSIGGLVVTALAQLFPNWRHFQLACALCYIFYLPYWWILPESPRWLLIKDRNKEARAYFKKSARYNQVAIPQSFDVYLPSKMAKEGTVLTLFKTPNLRKKTLIVCVLWFCVSAVFFGMNFNVSNLTGNIFVNNYLLQATGVFEFLGIWYIEWGRRPAITTAFLTAAVMAGALPIFASAGISLATKVLAMVGKFLIETNFEMIYIATSELYPTTARVTALGLGSSLARLGGAIAPYLVLSNELWPNLPYIIFCVMSLVAGLLAIQLPESKGMKLPDSINEAENNYPLSPFCCCLTVRQTDSSTPKSDSPTETREPDDKMH